MSEAPQTKKFQKGERTITPASQKASKYYPAEDEAQPRKVRNSQERCGSYGDCQCSTFVHELVKGRC